MRISNKTVIFALGLLLGGLFATGAALAQQTRYVSDELVITLRTGQGNQYQILRTLPSGTRLTLLEETDTGYCRVRTQNGTEGWVRCQYLVDEPVAAQKLERAERLLAEARDNAAKYQQQLEALRKEKRQLDEQLAQLQTRYSEATAELEKVTQVAAKPIMLERQNRELKTHNETLENELKLLKQENQLLKDRSKRDWFLAGAAVIILGIIIGLIIPKLRVKRRDSWSF